MHLCFSLLTGNYRITLMRHNSMLYFISHMDMPWFIPLIILWQIFFTSGSLVRDNYNTQVLSCNDFVSDLSVVSVTVPLQTDSSNIF
jgi:hypothetical protein